MRKAALNSALLAKMLGGDMLVVQLKKASAPQLLTSGSADPRSTDELYSTADRLYQQCMVAEGYKLVPRAQ